MYGIRLKSLFLLLMVTKKAEVAILTSDKIDFNLKIVRKKHYVVIRGSIYQEDDITIINICIIHKN